MFGSEILEVALGLLVFFLLLSLACTAATSVLTAGLRMKERHLRSSMGRVLDGRSSGLSARLFEHPLVRALEGAPSRFGRFRPGPLRLPARLFRVVLPEVILEGGQPEGDGWEGRLRDALSRSPDAHLHALLEPLLAAAPAGGAAGELEAWYDTVVVHTRERYAERARLLAFITALVACAVVNADALSMYALLLEDAAVRELGMATIAALDATPTSAVDALVSAREGVQAARVPLGWSDVVGDPRAWPTDLSAVFRKIVGLLISAFAASLGATFWFDLLKKLANLGRADASLNPPPPAG